MKKIVQPIRAGAGSRAHAPGFNLLEVLASMVLTGVILVSIVALFSAAVLQHRLATETTRGTMLASSHLEFLTSLPKSAPEMAAGTSNETLARGFVRRTHITDNAPSANAKTITVSVSKTTSTRQVRLIYVRP